MIKTKQAFLLLLPFALIILMLSCRNDISPDYTELLNNNPVVIIWEEQEKDLESYRAEVDVFAMNSRTDTGAVLIDRYSMSILNKNDVMYTRIDMREPDLSGRFRSIVSDGTEMVMFETFTNTVNFRMPISNPVPPELDFFRNEAMLSRVNLSLIRNEAYRHSFSIMEDSNSGGLTLELPSGLFPQQSGENRISTRAVFDISRELLNHTEVVTILDDGTRRTTSSYPVYQEFNDTWIKTGTVHIIENQNPNRVPGLEGVRIYNSPDDYPQISQAEYERLAKEGLASPGGEMYFGDPADLSYTMTIIEIYRNVEINTVNENAFRILGGF